MTTQQRQTIQANITLIRSVMAHQFTREATAFTHDNISGEYEIIRKVKTRDGIVHHVFCNDNGIDLFLDENKFQKFQKGEMIKVGRHDFNP